MPYLLIWWLILVLLGLAAFPVAFRFLTRLPDRGYTFVKPLALLLVAYPFWLLTAFGLLENTFGAIALIVLLVAVLSWGYGLWKREEESPLDWLRANWRHVVAVEAVFTVAFFAFAYYRAFNPEIQATEKPMEFMFVNSILKSNTFPPHDSWMSGYAISYYYLGYVIVAMLTRLTAVPSNYAFNLALTMIYALSATGAFGLVYNLIEGARPAEAIGHNRTTETRRLAPYLFGLLAAVMLLVMGNFEGVFESLHNANIGGPGFYQWLDINGLAEAPKSGTLVPQDNWWWWRASRVVNDHNPTNGEHIEVIDEFPSFSFLLGDLHPHVLALPFGLLALAVAFNVFRRPIVPSGGLAETFGRWLTPGMLLTAVIVGSLSMLNTWDIATYGFVVIAAWALAEFRAEGRWSRDGLVKAAVFGVALLFVSYLLYMPFYIGFTSQVGGILPTVVFKTPLQQYLMMFGLFVFVLATFVGVLIWQRRADVPEMLGEWLTWILTFFAVPIVIVVLGTMLLLVSSNLRDAVVGLLGLQPGGQIQTTMVVVLQRYVVAFAYSLAVFLLMTVLLAGMIAIVRQKLAVTARLDGADLSLDTSVIFALLLGFTGLLLTFGVEFLYLRDTFGTRMNTVFKLYFQAWTLFSIAAAFGAYYIWRSTRTTGRVLFMVPLGFLLLLGLVYPAMAYPARANGFQANATSGVPTLDGTLWIGQTSADVYAAIDWLNKNAASDSTILEAPGGSYTFTDQISMGTGLPTVVGWTGHELQWRGSGDEAGRREGDVERIYKGLDVNSARNLLQQYGVNYVIVGPVERDKYSLTPAMIDKFAKMGKVVFNQGDLRIYQVGS